MEGINTTEVETLCEENAPCRFDFIATKDRAIAEMTLQQYKKYYMDKAVLSKYK